VVCSVRLCAEDVCDLFFRAWSERLVLLELGNAGLIGAGDAVLRVVLGVV
jgi:hypothetical protein